MQRWKDLSLGPNFTVRRHSVVVSNADHATARRNSIVVDNHEVIQPDSVPSAGCQAPRNSPMYTHHTDTDPARGKQPSDKVAPVSFTTFESGARAIESDASQTGDTTPSLETGLHSLLAAARHDIAANPGPSPELSGQQTSSAGTSSVTFETIPQISPPPKQAIRLGSNFSSRDALERLCSPRLRDLTPRQPVEEVDEADTTPWGIPVAEPNASDVPIAPSAADLRRSLPIPLARSRSSSDSVVARRFSSMRPAGFPNASASAVLRPTPPPTTAPRADTLPSGFVAPRLDSTLGVANRPVASWRSRLASLLPARPERWAAGVRAGLLYAPESDHDGAGGPLRPTLLAGLCAGSLPSTLVPRGSSFVVRLVGTHVPRARRGLVRVALSAGFATGAGGTEANVSKVHCAPITEASSSGYAPMPHCDSEVARAVPGVVENIAVRVVLAQAPEAAVQAAADAPAEMEAALRSGGVPRVDAEIAWEVGGRGMRRGGLPLRYGYYFVLGEACASRLYCAAITPEHVRLAAMAVEREGVRRREVWAVSRGLSYVVLRVSET